MSIPSCPQHGECKLVPAGISKSSGKPYGAFFACVERTCQWKPPKEATPAQKFEGGLNNDIARKDKAETTDNIARAVALKASVDLYSHRPEWKVEEILATSETFLTWLKK